MRLVADENIRGNAIPLLREAGYDVLSIYEIATGATDTEVLAIAVNESRILITYDKHDFGALIFRHNLPPPPGIILFRLPNLAAEDRPYFILGAIASRTEWEGHFWVIDERGVRSRPFPAQ